jgi:hypothetical protein
MAILQSPANNQWLQGQPFLFTSRGLLMAMEEM